MGGKNENGLCKTKEIFEKAFAQYGDDTRSCLWERPMIMRYEELKKIIPESLEGKSILEIGCGLGGLYEYLVKDCKIQNIQYTGIDIVDGMIETAKKKYPNAEFMVWDVFEKKLERQFDYVILCGVFNVTTGNDDAFMKKMLSHAYSYCEKGMAFNYISNYVNFKSEEMAYHNPEDIFSFCVKNLTKKVNLFHHYAKCDVAMYLHKE